MTKDPNNTGSNNAGPNNTGIIFRRKSEPVRFADKFTSSNQFKAVFDEGMALVEETASYLDGEGRAESRSLPRLASLGYATESMRLTTRLMQLASWLLLQRAVNEGELTPDEARSEKHKVRLRTISEKTSSSEYDELPANLRALVERSFKLHTRVLAIDKLIAAGATSQEDKSSIAVHNQLNQLADAFGTQTDSGND
ncbi:MAG: DUF1465 family protein [Fimbriimonadaceae bacterium]|nr:DUF1465 family protein [Alphaproteobacteria bacterium]